jgi:hypothetical protein
LRQMGEKYADAHAYKQGPNWRLRTIRRGVKLLGFEGDLLRHGVRREVFMAPLASNYREFLRSEHGQPRYYQRPLGELVDFFKSRWMIPRSERIGNWKEWTRSQTWELILNGASWSRRDRTR